jgi:hypothetical protein
MTGCRAKRGPWHHQLDGNCDNCTFLNACLMFAGKTQTAYRASITAAHHRNELITRPSAPVISQTPVIRMISRGAGAQLGIIGRKASGDRKWMKPAPR